MHKNLGSQSITHRLRLRNKKGGGWLESNGYKRVVIKGRRTSIHRLVVEEKIGRQLTKYEQVHHRNGDKLDNRIENLEIVKISDHLRLHKTKYPILGDFEKECGSCHKIKFLKDYHKRKSLLGYTTNCTDCENEKHREWVKKRGYKKINGKFTYTK